MTNKTTLAAPQPKPVAYRSSRNGGKTWIITEGDPTDLMPDSGGVVVPLIAAPGAAPPAAPAPAVPLTEIQLLGGLMDAGAPDKFFNAFKAGARFAEKQHGIGGGGK